MAKDEDEKPEWDGAPEWLPHALRAFERMTDRMYGHGAGAAIAFTITRAELHVHLVDRAEHWTNEAASLRARKDVPELRPVAARVDRRGAPVEPLDPRLEAAMREQQIALADQRAALFTFAAAHLIDAPRFGVDLQTAQFYELIPSPTLGDLVGVLRGQAGGFGGVPMPPFPLSGA